MTTASSRRFRSLAFGGLLIVPAALQFTLQAADKKKEDEETIILSPFCIDAGNLGATPGGAKDIRYFRMGASRGQMPHPNSLTAEGLFSEHHLPLDLGGNSEALFRVQTAATTAEFELLPRVRYLAQLGFSSGLRADTWRRAPLNLVAVVDKSGSMSGEPLALVRASLHGALAHLREGDQISIVLYGDRSHVHLAPTAVTEHTRAAIGEMIDAIESAGSTSMEAGLQLGYQVARESGHTFSGHTRVMLFTDERPNVGNTAAEGFMAMAEAASRDGIGLTTIGVGVQFGAELATKISSVRGGNLFFFEDPGQMRKTFTEDFDTMVTELAHELSLRIEAAPGFSIAGVFGLPADMLHREGKAIVLDVATIFLSKRHGAIYFALSADADDTDLPAAAVEPGAPLAEVALNYRDARDDRTVTARTVCRLLAASEVQAGLSRGSSLIDQYLTLKKAAQVHLFDNDQESAFRLVHGLLGRLVVSANADAELAPERDLVRDIHNTLALLSGHAGEVDLRGCGETASPLAGVWRRTNGARGAAADEFLILWPNGVIEPVRLDRTTRAVTSRGSISLAAPLPAKRTGVLAVAPDDEGSLKSLRFQTTGDRLTLHVSGWEDGSDTLVLKRAAWADLSMAEPPPAETCIDSLSGLPVSDPAAAKAPARRWGRPGIR